DQHMKKTNLKWKLAVPFLLLMLVVPLMAGCGSDTAEKQPIIFGDLSWDSAQAHNQIAAFILENGYGYPASVFIPGDTIPIFAGTSGGDVHVNMEVWVENQQEAFDKAIAAGTVVDLGENFWDNWQGWLVPTYMVEDGLIPADITVDQMPDYAHLFPDPEDSSKGAFYSCIAGWQCQIINEEKFVVYDLTDTYNIILPGSGAALLASLKSAYAKHEPWFGYYWAPTPALGQLDMTVVREPAYDEAVWNANHGCDYPAVKVNVVVNAEWADTIDKEVIYFLTAYVTTTPQVNDMLGYMDANEASTRDAAIYFLKKYEDQWTKWVPSDVADKVKAALP
ncbi:MAG: ABC transporter substrate-binding protein, partial [Dehalococcoidales bacterium]|nr:ABC transporter substrate-binding protein [Dehalococcoidales bacterium]